MLGLKLGLSIGTILGSGGGGGGATLSYDPPVSADLVSSTYYAFGFDRLVEGFSGNTVQLKRLSDNATANFGFDSMGGFDIAAVHTWRSGANVDVIKFYDQMGSGKEHTAQGQSTFIVSDVVNRFGTIWSSSNGQLTRSTTEGGVGASTGDGVAAFTTGALTIPLAANGLEIHLLMSPNERKGRVAYTASDAFGANSTTEYWMWYGVNSNNFVRHQVGSDWKDLLQYYGGSTDITSNSNQEFHKQYSQEVFSYAMTGTTFNVYAEGKNYLTKTHTSKNATAIPAGSLDNGGLIIGGRYGTSLTAPNASDKANMIFGGVILTKTLTDAQRYLVQSKLHLLGQKHRAKLTSELVEYFDDYILFKETTGSTAVGKKGKLTLNINTSTVAEGTPNWSFQYTQAGVGAAGLRAPTVNQANSFVASNNFFAGTTTGTIISAHYSESSGNNLPKVVAQGTGNGLAFGNVSLSLGYDHAEPSMMAMMAASRDTNSLMGTRHKADENLFGAAIYDLANQSQGKYNRNTSHSMFKYNEKFSSHTWDADDWANAGDQPYNLDGPVVKHCADNIKYVQKDGAFIFQCGTFEAPAGYSRGDAYSARKLLRLQSDNWSYVSNGAPIGHRDGSIANNPYGGVVDSDDNATIQTMNETGTYPAFCGSRYFLALCNRVLTQSEVEEVNVNLYKFIT